jgi:hypothetical protein
LDDKDTKECADAVLKWIRAAENLVRALKQYLELEGSTDTEALDKATTTLGDRQKEFNQARKLVKEKCDETQTYEWSFGRGIRIRIDPDIGFTSSQYKALTILLKVGKNATDGSTIVLKPTKADRPVKGDKPGEPKKELGGTYNADEDEITIYDWNGKGDFFAADQLRLMLKHEFGHRVLDRLGAKEKKKGEKAGKDIWEEFWKGKTGEKPNKDPISEGGKMPNDYAGTDAGEGFAHACGRD